MLNCKAAPTLAVENLKLSKEDDQSSVDPTQFKMLVESLMYLIETRPNIMYGVSLILRFMDSPKDSYCWQDRKRILRYISGTNNFRIIFSVTNEFKFIGYKDSDWVCSMDVRKNTSVYVFHFGTSFVLWASKKKPIVTLSSTKAEYA